MEIAKTLDGNAAMLSLSGPLDTDSVPKLEAELKGLEENVTDLVLDLEGVPFVCGEGLRLFVLAQRRMKGRGSFTLIRAPFDVLDVLRITGLAERINILS